MDGLANLFPLFSFAYPAREFVGFLCLINRQHIYASFNRPVGRGVSTRGVHILIKPGVVVLSHQLRAFSVANLNAHAYLNTETAVNSDASHSLISHSTCLSGT